MSCEQPTISIIIGSVGNGRIRGDPIIKREDKAASGPVLIVDSVDGSTL